MDSLFISIAGFSIKIVFHPIEVATIRTLFKKYLVWYLNGFIVRRPKTKVDFTIEFTWDQKNEVVERKVEREYFIRYFRFKNTRTIESYYHISVYQFQTLLRDILDLLLMNSSGFMLHASASCINNKASIFVGKSGAGKSTTVTLLKRKYKGLADDSVIIKKERGKYSFYQTPFMEKEEWIKREHRSIHLDKVYLLKKAQHFSIRKLENIEQLFATLSKQIFITNKQAFMTENKVNEQLKKLFTFINSHDNFFTLYFAKNEEKLQKLIMTDEKI